MDGDDLVKFVQRILFDGHNRAVMPRIVHENVYASEPVAGCVKNAFAVSFFRQIGSREGHHLRAAASSTTLRSIDFFRGGREFRFCACSEKHGSALTGEEVSDCSANSTADPVISAIRSLSSIRVLRIEGSWRATQEQLTRLN